MEQPITDAKEAVAKARSYLKEMLGHPYFETETLDVKQDGGYWKVQLELVHMIRPERSRYEIQINAYNGIIEKVVKIEPGPGNNH
ncbi:MAG: hypothetical protein AB1668_02220 [Nanoarchaeota archaeon]